MDKTVLKPCPCGAEFKYLGLVILKKHGKADKCRIEHVSLEGYPVKCWKGPLRSTAENAIGAWNERPGEDA